MLSAALETERFQGLPAGEAALNIAALSGSSSSGNSQPDLDLFSISQTKQHISPSLLLEIESELEQSVGLQSERCDNGAPFVFFVDQQGQARIVQGCCNNWLCQRCGHIRARKEYGRIVHGAEKLREAGHTLFFWTLTCRGRDMPLEQAQADYLLWTNRLLTSARAKQKRAGGDFWAYAQVTERQKRQHPHSHLITTYCPPDAQTAKRNNRDVLVSKWFSKANETAGLGPQHEITEIRNPVAVAVYVAKYLFKASVATEWPKNWRRIRYSRSWPKLPEMSPDVAFPLLKMSDWNRAATYAKIRVDSQVTLEKCYAMRLEQAVYIPTVQ